MTREQAIKHLEVIKGDCALVGDIRALDIAISALSTEGEYIKKADMERILYSTNNAVRIGEEFLELPTYSLPDSENKGEWIPISERLPKEGETVLVCYRTQGGIAQSVCEWFDMPNRGIVWSTLSERKPIAWQPLPEPYKGE